MMTIFIGVFLITLLGLQIYKKSMPPLFPSLLKPRQEGFIVNGAGGVLWDVSSLFSLYLVWHLSAPKPLVFFFLGSSLCFALLGLVDDIREFSPKIKLFSQSVLSVLSVFFYFYVKHIPFGGFELLCWSFALIWLLNSINFLDILDGLATSVSFLLFLPLVYLGLSLGGVSGNTWWGCLSVFWCVSLLAFLTQNIHKPSLYLGDTGAHLLGCVLFFLSAEFYFSPSELLSSGSRGMVLLSLYSFLCFDFVFVCVHRGRKKQSLLLKSDDHLMFFILEKTGSKKITLGLFCLFQAAASLLAYSLS